MNRPSIQWTEVFEYTEVKLDTKSGAILERTQKKFRPPQPQKVSFEAVTRVINACEFLVDSVPARCSPKGENEEIMLMCVPLMRQSHEIYSARVERALARADSVGAVLVNLLDAQDELKAAHRAHVIDIDSGISGAVPAKVPPYTILADEFALAVCSTLPEAESSKCMPRDRRNADTHLSLHEKQVCVQYFSRSDQPALRVPSPKKLCATALEALVDIAEKTPDQCTDQAEWTRELVARITGGLRAEFADSPEGLCVESICAAIRSTTEAGAAGGGATFRIVPLTAYSAARVVATFADRGLYSTMSESARVALEVALGTLLTWMHADAPEIFMAHTSTEQADGLAALGRLAQERVTVLDAMRRAISKLPMGKDVHARIYARCAENFEVREPLENFRVALGMKQGFVLHVMSDADNARKRVMLKESRMIAQFSAMRQASPADADAAILQPLLRSLEIPADRPAPSSKAEEDARGVDDRGKSALLRGLSAWKGQWTERPEQATELLYAVATQLATCEAPLTAVAEPCAEDAAVRERVRGSISAMQQGLQGLKGRELLAALERYRATTLDELIAGAPTDLLVSALAIFIQETGSLQNDPLAGARGREKRARIEMDEKEAAEPLPFEAKMAPTIPILDELGQSKEDEFITHLFFYHLSHLKFTWSTKATAPEDIGEIKEKLRKWLTAAHTAATGKTARKVATRLKLLPPITAALLDEVIASLETPRLAHWLAREMLRAVKDQDPLEYMGRWKKAERKRSGETGGKDRKAAFELVVGALSADNLQGLCKRMGAADAAIAVGDMNAHLETLVDFQEPGMPLADPFKPSSRTMLAYSRMRLAWDLLSNFHRCMAAELKAHLTLVKVIAASTCSSRTVPESRSAMKRAITTLIGNPEYQFTLANVHHACAAESLEKSLHGGERATLLPVRARAIFEVFERVIGAVENSLGGEVQTSRLVTSLAPLISSVCQNSNNLASVMESVPCILNAPDRDRQARDNDNHCVFKVAEWAATAASLPALYASVIRVASIKASAIGRAPAQAPNQTPGKTRPREGGDGPSGPNTKAAKMGTKMGGGCGHGSV